MKSLVIFLANIHALGHHINLITFVAGQLMLAAYLPRVHFYLTILCWWIYICQQPFDYRYLIGNISSVGKLSLSVHPHMQPD